MSPTAAPILVTGAHRSGTTWVGRILAASGRVVYINEPLNRDHRPGVFAAAVPFWYFYLHDGNAGPYRAAFQQTLALRYGWTRELRAVRSPRDLARMVRDGLRWTWGRLLGRRPLLKDPFALPSVPWFVRRLGVRAVVLVRHPAAVAASWLRLGWVVHPRQLLAQPALLAQLNPAEVRSLEAAAATDDRLAWAAAVWRALYARVLTYRDLAAVHTVRHEDLARAPQRAFAALYAHLGLPFDARARRAVARSTQGRATHTDPRRPHATALDSRAVVRAWQRAFTPEQVARLRALTAPVADHFYTPADWEMPHAHLVEPAAAPR